MWPFQGKEQSTRPREDVASRTCTAQFGTSPEEDLYLPPAGCTNPPTQQPRQGPRALPPARSRAFQSCLGVWEVPDDEPRPSAILLLQGGVSEWHFAVDTRIVV